MRSRKTFFAAIATVFSSLISGCETGEISRFEHPPSESFYEEMNYYSPELDEYKDQGVLFVISIKQLTYNEFSIWLGLYAADLPNLAMQINRIRITGDEWEESHQINREIEFSEAGDTALLTDAVRIGVSGDSFTLLKNSPSIIIEVVYSTGTEDREMRFLIERRVEKHIAFPT
ncbi:hypothetical protein [Bisbaumannia pacifica]|uniref:Uncharacterized protein n=1 Tax=Bisbaumannia pacifica TaxID=77098 RepID=A0ABD4L6M5_9GAMM|nr:hypothetical protein [Halomonas pacifica]MBH8581993.1 hypothetical protein [Halomonas pacifica]